MKVRIWTPARRPWILGGDVNAPLSIEAEPAETRTVQGYTLHRFTNGEKTVIAEESTGGTVGPSFEAVEADIAQADEAVLARQMVEQKARGERACPVDDEEFWSFVP